jgi:hypothetical protein
MQETEFKYYSGSSRSCLSPSIKLVSHVESRRVQLIKDLTLALLGNPWLVKDVICVQEQEAMRHGINQLSLSERRRVEKTLKLPMYTVLIEPGCGKLLLSSCPMNL